jgi:hypothetical protein
LFPALHGQTEIENDQSAIAARLVPNQKIRWLKISMDQTKIVQERKRA